jgi:hypothetical protein
MLSSSHSGYNADFVTCTERSGELLKEADVVTVDIYIDIPMYLAILVPQTFFELGEADPQLVEAPGYIFGFNIDINTALG